MKYWRFKVSPDEEIFISGDFATYIQNFNESISCCKARYVPNKFHFYKTLEDTLPNVYVDDYSLNDDNFQNYLIKEPVKIDDDNARKLKNILVKNPKSFKSYLDPEYLGFYHESKMDKILISMHLDLANMRIDSHHLQLRSYLLLEKLEQ